MERTYIEEKTFDKTDFAQQPLTVAGYENCRFINCDLSHADLSGIHFMECSFTGCNLSMAKLIKTSFRDVCFSHCKLLGLHFEQCDHFLFSARFDNCQLNLCSFYQVKMKKTGFKDCNLREADLTETDLSQAVFENCDLMKVIFDNTILEKADLRTAYNYSIDPDRNRIKKAKFSIAGIAGLLDKYDIEVE